MKPINSRFLKGSGTYYEKTGKDTYGKAIYGDGVSLGRFMAMTPKKNSMTSMGEQANDQLIIYFDCKKSTPRGQTFAKENRIEYNGVNYEIREAQLYPTPDAPHHWELRLT